MITALRDGLKRNDVRDSAIHRPDARVTPPMASSSHTVARYLAELHQSLGVGAPETSSYPALATYCDVGLCLSRG